MRNKFQINTINKKYPKAMAVAPFYVVNSLGDEVTIIQCNENEYFRRLVEASNMSAFRSKIYGYGTVVDGD